MKEENYIPLNKRSKKKQKAFNQSQRIYLNDINLSTKTFKDKRHLSRAEEKQELRKEILDSANE